MQKPKHLYLCPATSHGFVGGRGLSQIGGTRSRAPPHETMSHITNITKVAASRAPRGEKLRIVRIVDGRDAANFDVSELRKRLERGIRSRSLVVGPISLLCRFVSYVVCSPNVALSHAFNAWTLDPLPCNRIENYFPHASSVISQLIDMAFRGRVSRVSNLCSCPLTNTT